MAVPEPLQPYASVAVMLAVNVPVLVGVPVTWPLPAPIDSPGAKPLALQVIVPWPPLCVNVAALIAVL